jgi:hypothetical protein
MLAAALLEPDLLTPAGAAGTRFSIAGPAALATHAGVRQVIGGGAPTAAHAVNVATLFALTGPGPALAAFTSRGTALTGTGLTGLASRAAAGATMQAP